MARDAAPLPTGTVTFLFSDIEGSTRLVQSLGDRFTEILETQQRLLREAFSAHTGIELGTEGDSFFVVFADATDAAAAAITAQRAVAAHDWPDDATVRVRMGLHTGEGKLGGANYVGLDVHRAARIAGAAHGAQVLISESTAALVKDALADEAGLRNLGEHRLKDLLNPERIYQIVHPALESEFPPLATLTHRPNNLPTQTSEFLGRATEVAAVGDLLGGGARLVTLTGPGGIGKTRLALQVAAARTEEFTDGLFFVDLSPVREADKAFEAAVRAIGLPESAEQRPLDVLKEQLAAKHMLLVLDNLEQVMDAADGVAELLQRCSRLRVLATSREALRVRGEHIFPIPPLSLPEAAGSISAAAASASEAVNLFVERAAEVRGGFMLTDENAPAIVEICARLDGLPLAIELAAARLTLFSPQDLLQRLRGSVQVVGGGARDLPARQQTLRDTIRWSYELLDVDERTVFRVLSVFPSAPLPAVEEVSTRIAPLRNVSVIDRVASLVDKSLVRSVNGSGPQRLSMLTTIHEYASERLAEEPSLASAARRAHAEYFSEFARSRRAALEDATRDEALGELETEVGNLLTAWRFWVEAGDLARLEELLESLWLLHEARGWYASAVELAQDLLRVLSAVPSSPDRVQQKITLATSLARGLLALRGLTKEVEEAYARVRLQLEEAGGLPQLYPALRNIWNLHLYQGDFEHGLAIGRQLLELAEQSNDVDLVLDANVVLGANLGSMGEIAGASEHLERAITLFDPRRPRTALFRLGPHPGVVAHTTSAFVLWLMGEPDASFDHSRRGLEASVQLNHPYTRAYALFHSAFLDTWRSDFSSALDRAGEALRVSEEHGYPVWQAVSLVVQGTALSALGKTSEGLSMSDRGLALYQELSTPPVFWPFILSLRARGFLHANRAEDAIEIADAAAAMLEGRYAIVLSDVPVLKGDVLFALSRFDEAESWFERGIEVGREKGARTTELRAATRLVRSRHRTGREPDWSDILRSVLATFAGKMETADVADARAVLEGR